MHTDNESDEELEMEEIEALEEEESCEFHSQTGSQTSIIKSFL